MLQIAKDRSKKQRFETAFAVVRYLNLNLNLHESFQRTFDTCLRLIRSEIQ